MKTSKWLLLAVAVITCGALFAATGQPAPPAPPVSGLPPAPMAPGLPPLGRFSFDDHFPGHGVWTGEVESSGLHLSTRWESSSDGHRSSNNIGRSYPASMLSGADVDAYMKMDDTPARFQISGDAGTVSFTGSFRGGEGAGHFSFAPNHGFGDAVKALGVTVDSAEDLSDGQLFSYTLNGLTTQYIRDLRAVGYHESLGTYAQMSLFGVTQALIRELGTLGYTNIPADNLVTMRIHGVTPAYIRAMKSAGFDHLDVDELVTSRIHRATPEFAAEMKAAGYPNLKLDELVTFRIHGVTSAFIRDLHALGYDHLAADDLVSFRIHGVSPQFIKELHAAGYEHVPAEKLIEMRIHGIDGSYIRKMSAKKQN